MLNVNMFKKGTARTIAVGVFAILTLFFGSNPEVQEAVSYFTGLSKDFTEAIEPEVKGVVDSSTGVIDRVVDGDTIVLEDGRKIRYLYVDTPETKKPGTPIMCYGPEATAFNKAFTGTKVELVADKEAQDRYGRDLRLVFLEGRDTSDVSQSINGQLVKFGFARVKIYKPNDTFEDEMRELEMEAKEENIGAWKNCDEPFEK